MSVIRVGSPWPEEQIVGLTRNKDKLAVGILCRTTEFYSVTPAGFSCAALCQGPHYPPTLIPWRSATYVLPEMEVC